VLLASNAANTPSCGVSGGGQVHSKVRTFNNQPGPCASSDDSLLSLVRRVVPVFTLLGHLVALLLISRPDQLSVMLLRMLAFSASLIAVLAFYVMATLTGPPPHNSNNVMGLQRSIMRL
jgi:hypothetical protein